MQGGKLLRKRKEKKRKKERFIIYDTHSNLQALQPSTSTNSRKSHTAKVVVTMATQAGRRSRQLVASFGVTTATARMTWMTLLRCCVETRAVMLARDGWDRLSSLPRTSNRALKGWWSSITAAGLMEHRCLALSPAPSSQVRSFKQDWRILDFFGRIMGEGGVLNLAHRIALSVNLDINTHWSRRNAHSWIYSQPSLYMWHTDTESSEKLIPLTPRSV